MFSIVDMFSSGMVWYFIPAALICIILHECAHGFAAYKLGDPTAKAMGRLTLNPIRHIDPVGLLAMVLLGFGWAKPVPVDMRYFRKPKRDMAIVGLAGPLMNFLIALVFMLAASAIEAYWWQTWNLNSFNEAAYNFCYYTSMLSVGLGIFNLIPFSPLDGSKILGALLPDRAYYFILKYERYGMIVLVGLMLLGNIFPQFDPFGAILVPARTAIMHGMQWLTRLPFGTSWLPALW